MNNYDGPTIPFEFGQGATNFVTHRLVRSRRQGPHAFTHYTSAIETEVDGAGVGGPVIMDVGFGVNVWKKGWANSPALSRPSLPIGQIDGIDIYLRNSGPQQTGALDNSDTCALGWNVVSLGDCGATFGFEGVTYSMDNNYSLRRGIDVQCGAINWTSTVECSYGMNVVALVGANDAGLLIQNSAGGTWNHAIDVGFGAFYLGMDGSIVAGAATGGNKGAGTINALAVYDDNALLTCPALAKEFLERGVVDVAKWDAMVPDHVIPAHKQRVPGDEKKRTAHDFEVHYDADGNGIAATPIPISDEVDIPEHRSARHHKAAHVFKAMLDDGFDPRDPAQYAAKLKRDEALPGMPSQKDWQHGALSMGELQSRLWLAVEMLALVVIKQEEQSRAIDARVTRLERRR